MRGADALVEMLILHGVKYIFGVPGDTSMAWHDALRLRSGEINYIICRDERNAAYAADAYARLSGSLGVFDVPSGGGALYAVPGLSEADKSNIPLLCIASEITISSEETNALTDCNQEALFSAVTKWNAKVKKTSSIPLLVRKAIRESCVGVGGATALTLPDDILRGEYDGKPEDLYAAFKIDRINEMFRNGPVRADIDILLEMIANAKQPMIIAGGGVHLSQAEHDLTAFAEKFAIPVATSLDGKGSLCEYSPLAIGTIGSNGGSIQANNVAARADLLIVLGCKMDNVTTMGGKILGKNVRTVQVDLWEGVLGNTIHADLPIMADIRMLLRGAAEADDGSRDYAAIHGEWLAYVKAMAEQKYTKIAEDNQREADRIVASRVFAAFDKYTDENAVHVGDAGTPTPYISANMRAKKAGRTTVIPRSHGALGYAIGASIGAQVARPASQIVCYCGDASFAMALGELETIKRLGLPIVLVNFQNDCFGWIKTIQRIYYHEQYFGVDFSAVDAVKIAEGFGIASRRVAHNAEIEEAVQWALAQHKPVLLNFLAEPVSDYVPPVAQWEIDVNKPAEERHKTVY